MRIILGALVLALGAGDVSAQNLTPEEIAKLVDEVVAGVDPYRALLDDPDPSRAQSAMQVMLEKGDTTLKRIALDYGLYSTDPVVRRMALASFFASGPVISVSYDGTAVKKSSRSADRSNFRKYVNRFGALDSEYQGFGSFRVGDWNEDKSCWMWADERNICMIRLSDANVSIQFSERWVNAKLDDDGVVRGMASIQNVGPAVPISIPITF